MTNPLPESAVELAARALIEAGLCDCCSSEEHKANARAALTAALPAIREAVVGEFAGLVEKLRALAQLRVRNANFVETETAAASLYGSAKALRFAADELAALTEQENRNG